jgi:hypothetical protein
MTDLSKGTQKSIKAGLTSPQGLPGGVTPGNQGENGGQGPAGQNGAPGANGANGSNGANGANGAASVGPHWGPVARNIIKSPVNDLRNGPFSPGANGSPPFGDGSLALETGDGTEKASFGNEVDFLNDPVADLNEVGYRVYTTGENSAKPTNPNMPSITIEVDPEGAGGTTTNFSSLVFIPSSESPSNQWSGYIDATDSAQGSWGLTGTAFNSPATPANCGLNGTRCSFDDVKTFLASGTGAKILSVQVSKGRDDEWQGAVDGLRVNDEVFDFELFGVVTRTP